VSTKQTQRVEKKKRKEAADELANLIYDVYVEERDRKKIQQGQNHANQTKQT
jgi:hypothetical protein